MAYLVSSNQAIFIVPDSSVLFGFGEPQAPVSFTNSTVKGTYAGSTTTPATLGVGIFSGEFTADGASPTGNITGIEDIGAPSGASTGVAANATYSVASTPTNGRGTIAGNVGGNGIMYTVSPSKFVVVFAERSKSRSLNLRTVAFTSNALCCELQRVAALWSQAFSRLECSLRTALSEDGRTEKTQCCTIPRQTAYSTRLTIS